MLLPLAAMALMAPQAGTTLATYAIGGRQVPVVLPSNPPDIQGLGPSFSFEGDRYEFVGGRLLRRPGSHDWGEFANTFRQVHANAEANAKVWHLLVVCFLRGDLLERAPNGLLTQRRGYFDENELNELASSIALFSALVEVATLGTVKVKADVRVETASANAEVSGGPAYDEAFLYDYFAPRLNGAGFETDDGLYRGPFDSVVAFYPAPSRTYSFAEVNRTPVSMVPIGTVQTVGAPASLANALFVEFRRALIWSGQQRGFGGSIHDVPVATDRDLGCPWSIDTRYQDTWNHSGRFEGFLGGQYTPSRVSAVPSAYVVPALDGDAMGRLGVSLKDRPIGVDYAESIKGERKLIWVSPSLADLALRTIQPQTAAAIGFFGTDGGLAIEGPLDAKLDFQSPQMVADSSAAVSQTFEPGAAEAMPRGGRMDVKTANDADKGSVGEFSLAGGCRRGWVRVLGSKAGQYLFDARTQTVSFQVRAEQAGPTAVRLVSASPTWGGATFGLFGRPRLSLETPADIAAIPVLNIPTDGAWHAVTVQVSQEGVGSLPVAAIEFCSNPGMDFAEPEGFKSTFWVDDVSIGSSAEPTPYMATALQAPSASSQNPDDRALFAATVQSEPSKDQWSTLRTLLGDPVDQVRLNALRVFSEYKDAASENTLIELSHNLNFRMSYLAMDGLALIGSQSAWAAIRRTMNIGPFDHNKAKAVELLGPKSNSKEAGALSVLIGSRSWSARLAAARAIGNLKGQEASIVLMAFLQDDDPSVRLAAATAANARAGVVGQRLLWASVNDPSDLVRAACARALARSGVSKLETEGYKLLKGEGTLARAMFLDMIASDLTDSDMPGVIEALSDPTPEVRAAAYRALANLKRPLKPDEARAIKPDTEPLVQAAMLDLVGASGSALPPDVRTSLLGSSDPNVAARSEKLMGSP